MLRTVLHHTYTRNIAVDTSGYSNNGVPTPSFPMAESGPLGDHYFLLIDGRRGRALVCLKSNPCYPD
jgi:hypothetical protein